MSNKCCYFGLPVKINPKQQFTASMFILGGSNRTEVTELALKARKLGPVRNDNLAQGCFQSKQSLTE
ncbi:MAG: hypothetical protein ACOX45_01775 [Acutalibacteraceae bacterium]